MAEYPKRERFFAHRFCRLLAKSCAANVIGADGCWLLVNIAMLEDSKRYTGPVTFYNRQLMALTGHNREHTFISVRDRCIKEGWLNYERGSKRRAGSYWVLVPIRLDALPDGPYDEDPTEYEDICTDEIVSQSVVKAEGKRQSKRRESVSQSVGKAEGKRQSILPIPSPRKPIPSACPAGSSSEPGVARDDGQQKPLAVLGPQELVDRWNRFCEGRPKLQRVVKLTGKRKDKITTRLKDLDWWASFLAAVPLLPLPGDGWQPGLDWLLANDHNVYRVLEGEFEWRGNGDPAYAKLRRQQQRNQAAERERRIEEEKRQQKQHTAEQQKVIGDILRPQAGSGDEHAASNWLFGEAGDSPASGAGGCVPSSKTGESTT